MKWSETTLRVVYILLEWSGNGHTKSLTRQYNRIVSAEHRLTLGAIRQCLYKLEQEKHVYREAGRFGVRWFLVKPVNPDLWLAACGLQEAEMRKPSQQTIPDGFKWSEIDGGRAE